MNRNEWHVGSEGFFHRQINLLSPAVEKFSPLVAYALSEPQLTALNQSHVGYTPDPRRLFSAFGLPQSRCCHRAHRRLL